MTDHINPGATPPSPQENFHYEQSNAADQLNLGGKPLAGATMTGGTSGAVVSPDPRGGMSAYQLSSPVPELALDDFGRPQSTPWDAAGQRRQP